MGIPVIEILKTIPDVFGLHVNEQPKYEVIEKEGHFEVRRYKSYRIAKTFVQGEYRLAMGVGFRRLADYIFGKNKANMQMPMTSPVFQKKGEPQRGEQMPIASPVFQESTGKGWAMTFIMPEKYSLRELPQPEDPHIRLEEVPAQMMATLRYSGHITEASINEKKRELMEWLHEKSRYAAMGQPFSAQYDPPFAISFLKRNEVMVVLAAPAPRRRPRV